MFRTTTLMVALAAFGMVALLPGTANAQQQQSGQQEAVAAVSLLNGATLTLKVDGMTCPFCAYGLEKRLRKIAAVDSVLIRVSDGLVRSALGFSSSRKKYERGLCSVE